MGIFSKLFKSSGPKGPRVNIEKRFRLGNRIGQGSMSKVWRATDTVTGRDVCLKVLDKDKTEQLLRRFVGLNRPNEGEMALSLNHPNIVKTYEHGITTNGEQFLVMEYVAGTCMNVLIDTDSSQIKGRELDLLIQTAEALAHVHEMNFIHRDVCPRNVMVDHENACKLIDFGLSVPNTPQFCKPGNRTGTASYMAPELIRRSTTDQRIDVFSFGVTAYCMFTKELPWEAAASLQAMLQHLNSPGRDPRELNPNLNDDVAEVLLRGIERDANQRFQSMREFLRELRRLNGESIDEEQS